MEGDPCPLRTNQAFGEPEITGTNSYTVSNDRLTADATFEVPENSYGFLLGFVERQFCSDSLANSLYNLGIELLEVVLEDGLGIGEYLDDFFLAETDFWLCLLTFCN